MDFWREHVMAIERDGWVSSEYARAHDLSVTSLYYWRAKFRSMAAAADTQSKFVTLNVTPVQGTAPSCVLTIGAVRMELGLLPTPEWLAPLPPQPLPKSNASVNFLALLLVAKVLDGLPLARFEHVLARWVIGAAGVLQPLHNLLRDVLLDGALVHMDETVVQVLKEPGKTPTSNSYMWVQTGGPPTRPVVLYDHDPGRSAQVPSRLLEGFRGYLMTDGYEACNAVARTEYVEHLVCWAHVRRRFVEAPRVQPKDKNKLGEALSYMHKYWPKLVHYVERKGWLFADTPAGAHASAVVCIADADRQGEWRRALRVAVPRTARTARSQNGRASRGTAAVALPRWRSTEYCCNLKASNATHYSTTPCPGHRSAAHHDHGAQNGIGRRGVSTAAHAVWLLPRLDEIRRLLRENGIPAGASVRLLFGDARVRYPMAAHHRGRTG
ncbi:IS66 family insertion sequence element accessory protein TnpA [Massilia mucilaginosa]|nr:transposase [Massilia mucilaginosa]